MRATSERTAARTETGELDVLLEDRADLPAAAGVRRAGERLRPRRLRARRRRPRGVVGLLGGEARVDRALATRSSTGPTRRSRSGSTGGKLNVSANCLDRHVAAGNGERVAFYWEGEDGTRKEITYAGLLDQTQRFANGLKSLGVGKGDVVGIYLPMVPEAAVAMLACTRIGAIHNVVFGGFSAELGRRADGGLRREGADHRRRDPAPRRADADEGGRRRRDRRRSTRSST